MPLDVYIILLRQVNKNIFFEEKKKGMVILIHIYIYVYINNQNYLYYNT